MDQFLPGLRRGERVSIRAIEDGAPTDIIGFVTGITPDQLAIVDRRGATHVVPRSSVAAGKRVGAARGRDPFATPAALLDDLVGRAGASGTTWLMRLSALLDGRDAPADVPAPGEWASFGPDGRFRARFEGEWVVVVGPAGASGWLDAVVDAGWWATRMGARSVCVVVEDADEAALESAGFGRLGPAR